MFFQMVTLPTKRLVTFNKKVLLDESNSTILGTKVADSTKSGQLSRAKLLQNIEKSYDKGKFLLDESFKLDIDV